MGRVSDNTLCRQLLGWQPSTALDDGLRRTYRWIERQVAEERVAEEARR
ncbi:hypothetical protein NKH77_07575 [Streptomyces sp. M19]